MSSPATIAPKAYLLPPGNGGWPVGSRLEFGGVGGIIGAEGSRESGVKPIYLVLLLLTTTAFAVDRKDDPQVVAACFVVHGRMYNSSGGSLARIWRIGTQRILGVTGPHHLPSKVEPLMTDFEHEVV